MKHIFSRTTLILIAFLSLERFTFFSIQGHLPMYLYQEFDIIFSEMEVLSRFLRYIPLLSYLIIGLTFDKVKMVTDLRVYFVPIFIGLLLMFIKTPTTFILGYSLLFFIGPFIKVNVIIKIFDYLKSISKDDDRVFILKFLALNIFSGLAPMVIGLTIRMARHNIDSGLIFPVLNLIVWTLFGLLFFFVPQPAPIPVKNKGGNSLQTLSLSIGGLIILSFFSENLWSSLYIENQDYSKEMIRGIIQMTVFFILGISLLFTPNLRSKQKINISTIIILFLGVLSLIVGIITLEDHHDSLLDLVAGLTSIFDIIFYPALIFILLDTFSFKYRAALLSTFYFLEFFISDIADLLRLIRLDTLISALMVLLIIGFMIKKHLRKNSAAHNTTSNTG